MTITKSDLPRIDRYPGIKLSVALITLNEEEYIEKALTSVLEIADEIIIVDSGSTDKTLEIAKKFGAKIFVRKFDNYSNQKNYALEKSKGEWVLSMDGDEEIEKDLSLEIKKVISTDNFDAYSIPRKNIILGKFIRFTRWQPELDRHVWLFKKMKSKWVGDIHEEVKVDGLVGKLNGHKVHYQYKTINEFIEMINRYSEIDSEEKVKLGKTFSYTRLFYQPIYNFLVRYFYRLGFLDGKRGFILSFLMSFYHFVLWVKIWEKTK